MNPSRPPDRKPTRPLIPALIAAVLYVAFATVTFNFFTYVGDTELGSTATLILGAGFIGTVALSYALTRRR